MIQALDMTGAAQTKNEPLENGELIELTILMPCLNEAKTLAACIGKARAFLAEHRISGEVLIADNGSTDGSREIARSCGARVVEVPIRGYGAALYHGSLAARGRFVIMGDSDDSYDFSDLMGFVTRLRAGDELVMGNRFRGGIKPGAMPWANRHIGNPILSAIGRWLFKSQIGDFYCGLRGFSLQAFKRMDLRTAGMEYAAEMVIKATLLNLRIGEVPTTLSPDGRQRPPHLRPWLDGWRGLRFMLLYSPRWLFFYPGLLLMGIGLLMALWLIPGPRRIGTVAFDVHTLFYSFIAIIIGFQASLFSLFVRELATRGGFLPPDPLMEKISRLLTLEAGLICGGLLFAVGLGGSIAAVFLWEDASFGDLDPLRMMRVVTPSGTAMCLGCQIVLSGLFLGVLRLGRRS
jgi:hypothetical protein